MKVKATSTNFVVRGTPVSVGGPEVDLPDGLAKRLESVGLVEIVEPDEPEPPADPVKPKPPANKASGNAPANK